MPEPSTGQAQHHRRRGVSYRTLRDAVITLVALGALIHETLAETVRPELLILIGSLLAVPAFLRADEALRRTRSEDEQ